MNRTALQELLKTIDGYDVLNPDYIRKLLELDKQQIVDAWVEGNKRGWAQDTDWPEHGEEYYECKYNENCWEQI